jgi:hypothetical protein
VSLVDSGIVSDHGDHVPVNFLLSNLDESVRLRRYTLQVFIFIISSNHEFTGTMICKSNATIFQVPEVSTLPIENLDLEVVEAYHAPHLLFTRSSASAPKTFYERAPS